MANQPVTYEDFNLEMADLQEDGTFTVRVLGETPGGEMGADAAETASYNADALKMPLRKLETRRLKELELIELGEALAEMMLPGRVGELFDDSLKAMTGAGKGLRVRLRIESLELAALPWEYAYRQYSPGEKVGQDFLALRNVSFTRYETTGVPLQPREGREKLRIVVALASPLDLEILDLEKDKEAIQAAVAELEASLGNGQGAVETVFLEQTTRAALLDALDSADIFHFSGSGFFEGTEMSPEGKVLKKGRIILETEEGESDRFESGQLATVLRTAGVRLVVLGTSESAARDEGGAWTGVAPALAREGIPAVVAMQFTVRDDTAARFIEQLYARVLAGQSIDEAVAAGRRAIFVHSDRGAAGRDWGVPVLYLRVSDGILFPQGVEGMQGSTIGPDEEIPVVAEAPYLPPGPGYISDAVSDDVELVDHLGIEREVTTIAHVMASKKVDPPLSLGLFGDWGSGKSFFMSKLRQQVAAIAAYYSQREKEEKKEYSLQWCTRVVQIDFNAWHYSDANLWASLVTRIYEALYSELKGGERTDEKTRRLIREKVQRAEEELEAAEAQVRAAKERVEGAEEELLEARDQRARQESTLMGLLGDVRSLLKPPGPAAEEEADDEEDEEEQEQRQALRETRAELYDELERAVTRLGYPEAAGTYEALLDFNGDLRTLSQRLQALLVFVVRSPGTVAALLLALVLYLLAAWAGSNLAEQVSWVRTWVVEASALVLPLLGGLSLMVDRGLKAINTVQSGVKAVEEARMERAESSSKVKEARQGIAEARAEEAAAESKLESARTDLKQLQSELDALKPERRLLHLLEERSRSGTYTQHLGIVSLVRSDFEQLSRILKELNEEERDLEKEAPPIQRIILYIDDLDRCRPEQVVEVLEAVHLLLAFPLFVVVVGVDPRWLRHSLRKQYPENLAENGAGIGAEQATPQQYLEKIFQIPFALRPVDKDGYEEMVGNLLARPPEEERSTRHGDGTAVVSGQDEAAEAEPVESLSEPGGPTQTDGPTQSGYEELAPEPAAAEQGVAAGKRDVALPPGVAEGATTQRQGEEEVAAEEGAEEEGAEETVATPILARPLNSEQLSFQSWEEKDVNRLWPMFHTPRTIKRFVNTYRLLRAGLLSPEAVARFEGSESEPGSYQIAILLLAVVTSYPHLASRFLLALDEWLDREEAKRDSGKAEAEHSRAIYGWTDVVAALRDVQDGDEWAHLLNSLKGIEDDGNWQRFTGETLRTWALRVSRYSFALDSSQALHEQFGTWESEG